MVIFLLDENKSKGNVDRLLGKGDKEEGKQGETSASSSSKKDTIPRPASIHAAINSPSRIYFKAVASNKKLPPAVIYYHSLSSNKQIKDHSVRLPTPAATAATIYYHSLDSNKQNHHHHHSRSHHHHNSSSSSNNSNSNHNTGYSVLGDDGGIYHAGHGHGHHATPTSPKPTQPRSSLGWHQRHVVSSGSGGTRSSRGTKSKSWTNPVPTTSSTDQNDNGNGAKPPMSPSPSTPPPSYITSKMLIKGGAFQQHYSHSHSRHPPSPLSPSLALPNLAAAQDKPEALVLPTISSSPPPVPLTKPLSILRLRKYHRTASMPGSFTLSSKSSGSDEEHSHSHSDHADGCDFLGGVSSMVLDATHPLRTEIQVQSPPPDQDAPQHKLELQAAATGRASQSQGSGSSVKFGQIEIVEFPIRLGDNPSVRFGAPIALGSKPSNRRTMTLEEYEQDRSARLSRNEIVLDVMVRSDMLKQSGCSQKEIRKAIAEAAEARESRKKHAEKFLKEHGWGSILASALDSNSNSDDGSSSKAKE
jgi:hypothetical protein